MEGSTKALILAALILADGFLTWASIEAGGAGAREANLLFEDTHPTAFIGLALAKAVLWFGAWLAIRDHPKTGFVTTGLTFVYSILFFWNLGNLAVNL